MKEAVIFSAGVIFICLAVIAVTLTIAIVAFAVSQAVKAINEIAHRMRRKSGR